MTKAIVFHRHLALVRVSRDQNVDLQLAPHPLDGLPALPRNQLVPVQHAYPKGSDPHHGRLGKIRVQVVVARDAVQGGRQPPELRQALAAADAAAAEVAGADHVLHLVGHQHPPDGRRDPARAVGDVQVAQHQHQLAEVAAHG